MTMSFICMKIKNHLQINGFVLSLALKLRLKVTQKWLLVSCSMYWHVSLELSADILNTGIACENSRFSSFFATGDVSRGGTSATQRQKFHTDDVKSVRNPVISADWTTE